LNSLPSPAPLCYQMPLGSSDIQSPVGAAGVGCCLPLTGIDTCSSWQLHDATPVSKTFVHFDVKMSDLMDEDTSMEVASNIFDTAPPAMLQVPFSTKFDQHEEKNSRHECTGSSPLSTPRSTTLPSVNESSYLSNDDSPTAMLACVVDVNQNEEVRLTNTVDHEKTEALFNKLFGDSDSDCPKPPVSEAFLQQVSMAAEPGLIQQVPLGSTELSPTDFALWDFAPPETVHSSLFPWAFTNVPEHEEKHFRGECRPCAYFYKNDSCRWGSQCEFCHLCPKGELKQRKKEKVRMLRAQHREEAGNTSFAFNESRYGRYGSEHHTIQGRTRGPAKWA